MEISVFLTTIAEQYDRHAGLRTTTQDMLRHARQHLQEHTPGGLHVVGSGGKGTATLTPWVGFFDPDETTSPEEGLYVVYLFAADRRSISLTLLQGITKLDRELGHTAARSYLADEAARIRDALPEGATEGFTTEIDLASQGFRQRGYSAACIAARRYEVDLLPTEGDLRRELASMLRLYQEAIAAKRRLAVTSSPLATSAATEQDQAERVDPLAHFRPKDDSDYVTRLTGRTIIKSRRHERLVREYGEWAQSQGFAASTTEHPRDLVLRSGGSEWLVEAKVLYRGNATEAVRAALGQLFTYQFFLYGADQPRLVALFAEPIGEAYVRLLDSLGVASVWKDGGRWLGSPRAQADAICEAE
jgi:hypothetical protein